jgi:DNA-binding response OmpR family regulator
VPRARTHEFTTAGFRQRLRSTPPRIFVVDPDADSRDLYVAYLSAQGFDAHGAADAFATMDVAHAQAPDLIISELALPQADGIELCRMIGRRYGRRVPIIIVTALASAYYSAQAKIAGAARVLAKPCTPDRLERSVRDTLETWQASVGRGADLNRVIRQWTNAHAEADQSWSRSATHTKARTRDGLVVGTLVANPQGVVMDADGGVSDLTGYDPGQLVGVPLWDLCPDSTRDKYRAVWRWFQTSGRLRGLVSVVDADGNLRRYQYASATRPAFGASVCAITASASVMTA